MRHACHKQEKPLIETYSFPVFKPEMPASKAGEVSTKPCGGNTRRLQEKNHGQKSVEYSFCKFHPLSAAIYAAVLFLFALNFRHPLYLLAFLFIVVSGVFLAGAGKTIKSYFIFAFWMTLPIVLINGLFSSAGETILWHSAQLPLLGKIIVTKEALFYGFDMGLKILLTVGIFCFYQAVSDMDEIFSLGFKTAPKSALIVIMAFSILPRVRKDLAEIKDAMTARGVVFDGKSFIYRIKTYFPLWRILLSNYLEGCWNTAESLHVRAFDTGKRSFYPRIKWRRRDYILTGGSLFSLTVFVFSLAAREEFKFHPVMDDLFCKKDLFFMAWLLLGMSAIFLAPAGQKAWEFLRLKN